MTTISYDGREESPHEREARLQDLENNRNRMNMKKALITGVTGQDGSYLADLLLDKGYEVIGLRRRSSTNNIDRISHLLEAPNFKLQEFEIADSGSVYSAVERNKPDEIYNLAAQSHVKTSFDQPCYTIQVNTIGVINFLEAVKRFSPDSKFYQASTSEMFGKNVDVMLPDFPEVPPADAKRTIVGEKFQNEETAFEPQSPYAAAKLASHHLVRMYREGYGLHASCGILFNHESERRGENFVTRKITQWVAGFKNWAEAQGLDTEARHFEFDRDYIHSRRSSYPKLRLGNIEAFRDWGHAEDYVNAMWLMLQQNMPDDYVIATGETYSVRDFLVHAFQYINIEEEDYKKFLIIDPKFYRPSEVEYLRGMPNKAEKRLGWKREVSFEQLVHRMLESDVNAQKEKAELETYTS
jgi:GDPmannose 4,6-dehydratase